MNFNKFQQSCIRTTDHPGGDLDEASKGNIKQGLSNAALGMCGEAGEVADIIKKHLHQGHELAVDKLKEEAGDQLFYIAHLCNIMGWKMEDLAKGNVAKLKKRYPRGFNVADSVKRSDAFVPEADPKLNGTQPKWPVVLGQHWRDKDKRKPGRVVEVVAIEVDHARVKGPTRTVKIKLKELVWRYELVVSPAALEATGDH